MSDSQLRTYFAKVYPAAQKIESKLGIPAPVMAAMMSWETASGTNQTTKYNNELGIKYVGQKYATGGKVAGMYAGYRTQDDFVNDVVRILGINAYGYPDIINTAKKDSSQWGDIIRAWNRSSWAEADYSVDEIVRRARIARDVGGGLVVVDRPSENTGMISGGFKFPEIKNPANMNQDELLKMAGVGVLVLGALALAKD